MANICSTTYVFRGSEEEVDRLYGFIKEVMDKEVERAKEKGVFAEQWVGNLLKKLGNYIEDVTYCRGEITYLEKFGGRLIMDVDSAWGRIEEIEQGIEESFPDIEIYYLEEELGCGIYRTNDRDGVEFSNKYLFDSGDDTETFETECELSSYINDYFMHCWCEIFDEFTKRIPKNELCEEQFVEMMNGFFGTEVCSSIETGEKFLANFDFNKLTHDEEDVLEFIERASEFDDWFGYPTIYHIQYED